MGIVYMILVFGALILVGVIIQKKFGVIWLPGSKKNTREFPQADKLKELNKSGGEEAKADDIKQTDDKQKLADLDKIFQSGISWFKWIAVLSIINTILILINAGWSFIFGLTATQFIDYQWHTYFSEHTLIDNIAYLVLYILIVGSVVLSWVLSKRKHIWAMLIGLILIILDGLLSFYIRDYWGIAFHAFVIFQIVRSYLLWVKGNEKKISFFSDNKSSSKKLKFSAYLILNIVIIFFFWLLFLFNPDV